MFPAASSRFSLGSDDLAPDSWLPETDSPEETFLKNLPKSFVPSLARRLLVHASSQRTRYANRAKNFDSLCLMAKHHPLEIVNCGLAEPILREASKVIASSVRGIPARLLLLRSAGNVISTIGHIMRGQQILDIVIPLISEHFPSDEDGRRHCAMKLVGICVKSFSNCIVPMGNHLWGILTAGIHDESPHVREAACFSIGSWLSHPQLGTDVVIRCTPLLPTVIDLCFSPFTGVAACTVLLPLLKRGIVQGSEHDLMILSFQLLEELPPPFKYYSPSIMGYVANSLRNNFVPYIGASMRRLDDFASLTHKQDLPTCIATMYATACFASAVGKEAFSPYLEGAVKNALKVLKMYPRVHARVCLTFLGVMARFSGETFPYSLPIITTTLVAVASNFTESDELVLAEMICHIVNTARGAIDPRFLSCVPRYINILNGLLSRNNPAIRLKAIHGSFRLILMLQQIQVDTIDEFRRDSFETQTKAILLSANLAGICYTNPIDQISISNEHILALDFILGSLEISNNPFPVSSIMFMKPAPLGRYVLDVSSYIPTLVSRCGSPYCPLVQVYAFATIAYVLATVDRVSWISIEAWVLRLLPLLYQGMIQGDPAIRPAAIRALGRLVYRTQLDLSWLHQSLLQHLQNIITTPLIAEFSNPTIRAAASTMSLILLKVPALGGNRQVFDILVSVLSSPLGINDTLLAFKALQTITSAHPMVSTATSLPTAMIQSYRRIILDSNNPSHGSPLIKEITQIMLSTILIGTIGPAQIEGMDPHFIKELHYTLIHDSNLSMEAIFRILTRYVDMAINIETLDNITRPSQLATIDRLPPEIIAQTMSFCLPQGQEWDLVGAEHMPLTLGQINSVWRQVALHTPRIWANLDIELGSGPHERRSSAITPVVSIWLTRSGGLPINITMKCLVSGPSLELHRHIDQLARAILPFSRFWRDVHLQLPFSSSKHFYQAHQKYRNMPRLRSFSLIGSGFALLLHEPPLYLESAPSLRTLELYDAGLDFNALRVSWSQLTELRLRIVGWTTQQCADMLSSCSQVKFLRLINKYIGGPQAPYVGPTINLPCLEVLHVNRGFNHLVLSITMPCLRELYTECSGFSMRLIWVNGGLGDFISTLARSKETTSLSHVARDPASDGQGRKFLFTLLDHNLLALPINHTDMLPDLAAFIQCLGMMEFDVSSCPDRALIDFVMCLLRTIAPIPTSGIAVVARRRAGEVLMRELKTICDENENVKLISGGTGLEVHISQPRVEGSKERAT